MNNEQALIETTGASITAQINMTRAFEMTQEDMRRPHVLMRPRIYPDGNQWCALYGDNLQEGIAGFGETPEKAARDFDKNWMWQKLV